MRSHQELRGPGHCQSGIFRVRIPLPGILEAPHIAVKARNGIIIPSGESERVARALAERPVRAVAE